MGYHNSHSSILNTNLIDRLILSSDTSHKIINDIANIMFKFVYLFIFFQQVLIEHLLCAKYHSWLWGFSGKKESFL